MMISVGSDILEIARVERLQKKGRVERKNAGKAREKPLVLPVILV